MSDTPTSPAIDGVLAALTDVIRASASPEIQEAQLLLLRRLALEGSVIPSRIPAPRNITEVGGYLNELTTLGLTDMRTQMMSAALGLAGSTVPVGWDTQRPPLRFVSVANDRPTGTTAATVTPTVAIRSDLTAPLASALIALHAHHGLLPLWTPNPFLPPASATLVDPLFFLGRVWWVAPTAALHDPLTDPITLGRAATDTGTNMRLAARVDPGTPGATMVDWTALVWDSVAEVYADQHLGPTDLLPLETLLAPTGFVPARPTARPTGLADLAWARVVNIAGLVPAVSRLGDELGLIFTPSEIAASAFSGSLSNVWNGTKFEVG